VVAHDLHPDYLSSKYALERDGVELIAVQHHHAHLAACLAEHGEPGPAVGAIFDGSGLGSDGTLWGGEILFGDTRCFERAGALRAVGLPGGAQAIRQPWRMACAWLAAAGDGEPDRPGTLVTAVSERAWNDVRALLRSGVATPQSTSMGRLFDAVSALCGVRVEVSYEGQAAIELEAISNPRERGSYPVEVVGGVDGFITIDPRATIRAVASDADGGESPAVIAARFHNAIAAAAIEACARVASARGVEVVVLSGGVFNNRRLLAAVRGGLERSGLRVLVPECLPLGDGGISYGQVVVAASGLMA
jgi:hydrogenase maturation protein HypF